MVTLLFALIGTESQFSEIFSSRNLSIALEPIVLAKICKKYGISLAIERYIKQNFSFRDFGGGSFQNMLLVQTNFMFHFANVKIAVKHLNHAHYVLTETNA